MDNWTKEKWLKPSPYKKALEDMFEDYSEDEIIPGREALEAVLEWNGHGLTANQLIDMVETFIGQIDKY